MNKYSTFPCILVLICSLFCTAFSIPEDTARIPLVKLEDDTSVPYIDDRLPYYPTNMIVDTDYMSDVDDVTALKIAALLHKQNRINLLGVATSTEGDYGTRGAHGQLSYEGLPNIPMGYSKTGVPETTPFLDYFNQRFSDPQNYTLMDSIELYKSILRDIEVSRDMSKINALSMNGISVNDMETSEDPAKLMDLVSANAVSADLIDRFQYGLNQITYNTITDFWHETISENKVRIVVLGYLTNIEDLLKDPEGYQLVAEKVDSIWVDGGAYPMDGMDNNLGLTGQATCATHYCINNCPVPIIFITNETGCNYMTGDCVSCGADLRKYDPDAHDPVSVAFREMEKNMEGVDTRGGYSGWDPLAVYAAALPLEECQMKVSRIDAVIKDNGVNVFTLNPEGRHAILERTNPNVKWYTEQMNLLILNSLPGYKPN